MLVEIWMVKAIMITNEKHVSGTWTKGDPRYKGATNLAPLCSYSNVLWKVELVNNEVGYLPEAISKQSGEDTLGSF